MTIDITNELDDKAKKDQYDRANSQEKRVIHDCRSKCSHSQADNMKKKEVTKLAHKWMFTFTSRQYEEGSDEVGS
jgi:hypothetical protein